LILERVSWLEWSIGDQPQPLMRERPSTPKVIIITGSGNADGAELASASREQALGIEQFNKAVSESDKVTQQNAASAEESASASEQMNAQASQMKNFVGDLAALVGGKETREVKGLKAVPASQVIPFDDEDFQRF
jgi:hypothetical protein